MKSPKQQYDDSTLSQDQARQLQDALLKLEGIDYENLQEDIGLIRVESPAVDVTICGSKCAG
jgi:hypothetical protein